MTQANIKAVITAEDRASSTLKGFGDNVEHMGMGLVNIAKKATLAFVTAATAATGFAVKSAADFEQTRIGLENMLGSADKARVLLKDISKFAADTPFEFPELAQATRQLVAFGFSADDAFKTMKELGDVSAAIGAPINDLAYLMGTLRAQGRAFTIDIRQFAMRGIPIYEYLAKVLKTDTKNLTELIETGKVGFPEVQKAFQLMTSEGGAFHNTMARQSKSLSGLFSTLKDSIGQTARELVGITQEGDIKEGSLFDQLRKGTAYLIQHLPIVIAQLKEIIRDIIPQLKQWADNIANVATQVGEYLAPKLHALWDEMEKELIPSFQRFWKEIIEPLIPVLGTALVLAVGALIDALKILIGVQAFMMDQTVLLKNMVIAHWNAMAGAVSFVVDAIKAFLDWINRIPVGVQNAMAGIADMLTRPFYSGFKGIVDGIQWVLDNLNTLKKALNVNVEIGKKWWEGGSNILKALPGFATGGFTGMGGTGDVAGVVHKGEYVVPKSQVDQNTGLPNIGGGSMNINVYVGMYAGTEMEKRKMAEALLPAFKDVMNSGNVSWGTP